MFFFWQKTEYWQSPSPFHHGIDFRQCLQINIINNILMYRRHITSKWHQVIALYSFVFHFLIYIYLFPVTSIVNHQKCGDLCTSTFQLDSPSSPFLWSWWRRWKLVMKKLEVLSPLLFSPLTKMADQSDNGVVSLSDGLSGSSHSWCWALNVSILS